MNTPSRILIYGLVSPTDNCLFYVGQTKKRREFRLIEHIEEAVKGSKTPVYVEMRKYMSEGAIPKIFVIEKVTKIELAQERELFWINWFLDTSNYQTPLAWEPQTPKSEAVIIEKVNMTNVRR